MWQMYEVIIMIIDISELIKEKKVKEEVSYSFELKSFDHFGDLIEFADSVKFNGFISIESDIIYLDGVLALKLKFICSRCLKDFIYPLQIEIHEVFSTNLEIVKNDDEIIFINNDNIDISEIAEANILMSIPIKKLCKDDCKGLCQHCGTDLNLSTCNCKKTLTDERLSKLKDLFLTD
jgi:uncharacterized protein